MSGIKLPAFDWDEANIADIGRHGVTTAEAEQKVLGASLPLATDVRSGEDRHTELGETRDGWLLRVIWTWRHNRIRVVTAFPANRKWRALWKRIRGEHNA